jgi:hypothetical protein
VDHLTHASVWSTLGPVMWCGVVSDDAMHEAGGFDIIILTAATGCVPCMPARHTSDDELEGR